RPRLLHSLAEGDEAVVGRDEEQCERGDDDDEDDELHVPSSRRGYQKARASEPSRTGRALARVFVALRHRGEGVLERALPRQTLAARKATPPSIARAMSSAVVVRPIPASAPRAASFQLGVRSPASNGSAISAAGDEERQSFARSTCGKVRASHAITLPPFERAPPATTRRASSRYVQPPATTGG